MRNWVFVLLASAICPFTSSNAEAGWLLGFGNSNACGEACENNRCTPRNCWSGGDCDECDCHRECCPCCGKKKPEKKKKCCLLTCFDCKEPPRAGVAVSFAAQIDQDAFREATENESARQESAQSSDERIDALERDLTRLTVVVSEVANSQKQQEQDLTKVTLILEKIAGKLDQPN